MYKTELSRCINELFSTYAVLMVGNWIVVSVWGISRCVLFFRIRQHFFDSLFSSFIQSLVQLFSYLSTVFCAHIGYHCLYLGIFLCKSVNQVPSHPFLSQPVCVAVRSSFISSINCFSIVFSVYLCLKSAASACPSNSSKTDCTYVLLSDCNLYKCGI